MFFFYGLNLRDCRNAFRPFVQTTTRPLLSISFAKVQKLQHKSKLLPYFFVLYEVFCNFVVNKEDVICNTVLEP